MKLPRSSNRHIDGSAVSRTAGYHEQISSLVRGRQKRFMNIYRNSTGKSTGKQKSKGLESVFMGEFCFSKSRWRIS